MQLPHLKIKPSRNFALLVLLIYGGAVMIVSWLEILLWMKLIIIGLSLLHMIIVLRRDAYLISKKSIVKLWVDSKGKWHLLDRQGQIHEAALKGDSLVTSYAMFLNFKSDKKKNYTVILFNDSLPPAGFRSLYIFIRYNDS